MRILQHAAIAAALWLSLSEAKQHVPADFLVEGLEEIEQAFADFDGAMYSGLLPMDNKNRHGELMFWLFAPNTPTIDKTLNAWSNGESRKQLVQSRSRFATPKPSKSR